MKIMGIEMKLYNSVVFEGVGHDLFVSPEGSAAVRIVDMESGHVVHITKYPSFDSGKAAFDKLSAMTDDLMELEAEYHSLRKVRKLPTP
jgi:hypothetical protein